VSATENEIKAIVRCTPVVNGFSYPFLKCLVNRLQETFDNNEVYKEEHSDPSRNDVVNLGPQTVVAHIAEQLRVVNPILDGRDRRQGIRALLTQAISLLSVFEDNN
jgi:hypothetical protein